MRVDFVTPVLRHIDVVKADALVMFLHKEDWPLRGAPGLVDWRVGGHLSHLREQGWITCDDDEVVLMPVGRRLASEKLLIVGMGSVDDGLSDGRLANGLGLAFDALDRLDAHASLIHLPGRPDRVAPDRAMNILLDVALEHRSHDEVFVLEEGEARDEMQRLWERRRMALQERPRG